MMGSASDKRYHINDGVSFAFFLSPHSSHPFEDAIFVIVIVVSVSVGLLQYNTPVERSASTIAHMAPVAKFLLAALLAAHSLVSAFSSLSTSQSLVFKNLPNNKKKHAFRRIIGTLSPPDNMMSEQHVARIRGGGSATAGGGAVVAVAAASASVSDPAAKFKKVRISAFDSMRFFLITCIVLGHFIRFAGPSDFWFKFFSRK
jgi:hypothetical protein